MQKSLFLFLIGVSLIGCQSNPKASLALASAGNGQAQMPAPTLTPTTLNPVLISTVAVVPPGQSSFAFPTAVPPTFTPTPTRILPTSTPVPSPTATPLPTFTPPALPFTSNSDHYWLWRPIADGGVVWTDKTYPYGSTRGGMLRTHHGVEFNVGYNTEVLAAASGTIVFAGSDAQTQLGATTDFYGNAVVIEHDTVWQGQKVYTLYGHLNEVQVNVGDHVDAKQVIGLSGATGVADGPHLHFEVRLGENDYDATRNPLLWLYPFQDRGTVAGQVIWAEGMPAREVPVTIHRIDAPNAQYYQTTTYADNSVDSDDELRENFVIDDVVAGYYEIIIGTGEERIKQEIWVFAYHTSFDTFILGDNGVGGIDMGDDE